MTANGRTVRGIPSARGGPLGRLAVAMLDRALRGLEGGTLEIRLPDGTTRRFGSGPVVTMTVLSPNLFKRLATRGRIGLGESYQAGEWTADDLVALLKLIYDHADSEADRHPILARIRAARPRPRTRQGLRRARRHIGYHYDDLGTDLFRLTLDETMLYSCPIFERPDEPLADAQRRKLRRVCEKLELGHSDHVLEIGCGWGSFALTAAGEYGARVTGLTISSAQADVARSLAAEAGLADRIRIVEQDYRVHHGSYSRLAAIEMIEAIGERQFPTFFAACDRLLAPGGRACIQSILIKDQLWDRYRRSPDWIERYIFPGCLLPSLPALRKAIASSSSLLFKDVEEIGSSYAETLRRWRANFFERESEVRALGYDDHFIRTWEFYLCLVEAGFRAGALHDAQLLLERDPVVQT
jgi:cyclopropane-fatty-acyl-phospholipid synthase